MKYNQTLNFAIFGGVSQAIYSPPAGRGRCLPKADRGGTRSIIKRIQLILTMMLLTGFHPANSQTPDTLTLEKCYNLTLENYPLAKQMNMLDETLEKRIENLKTNFYPQLDFMGQASYQSEVTYVQVNVPENPYFSGEDLMPPPIDKDQYKFEVNINQVIYDGGITSRQKAVEVVDNLIDKQQVEVELYGLKARVNDIYFGIVLMQAKEQLLQLASEEIAEKLKTVESAVRNGTMLESNADILKAELIKIEQQQIENEVGISSGFNILEELLSVSLSGNETLVLPVIPDKPAGFEYKRPEYDLLSIQQEKLQVMDDVLSSTRRPMLLGFGRLGYGRPGLNMLENEFDPYAVVGARLSWNIWDWNYTSNERQVMLIKQDIIDTRKETFEKNLKIGAENHRADVEKYEKMIQKDEEIIKLRTKIKETASSQLDNGVITSTDYLTEVNAEKEAVLNREIRKIQLIKAKVEYLTEMGKM